MKSRHRARNGGSIWGRSWLVALGLTMLASVNGRVIAQPAGGSETVVTGTNESDGTYPTAATAAAISDWLRKTTNIAPASAIAVGSDMVVTVARFGSLDPRSNIVKDVRLRGETISPRFSDLIQGRSTLVSLDVDCTKSMILIHQTDVYPASNLVGAPRILPGSAQWIKPIGTAYLSETINTVCQQRAVPPPLEMAKASAAPAPTPYQKPAAPTPVAPTYVPPSPVVPPRPSPPAYVPPTGIEVQVVAASTSEGASTALALVRSQMAAQTAPYEDKIQPIDANGRTVYRALFVGFPNRSAAMLLCSQIKSRGGACLVR